jgi:hypothetical protein
MFLSQPTPVTIAVCDHVHLDQLTKRKTLLGVYPHVAADAFPCTLPQVWLDVPFTGAQGILTLLVRVLDGETVLFEAGGQATCGDPGSAYELTTPVSGLSFSAPGVYLIEALADGVAFARRELRVVAKTQAAAYPPALHPSAS